MSREEFKSEDVHISGEVHAETMAVHLSQQMAATFRKLVEAGADEAALSFYRQSLNLTEIYQLPSDQHMSASLGIYPTVDELVDL